MFNFVRPVTEQEFGLVVQMADGRPLPACW
jgi:hypothetical protein